MPGIAELPDVADAMKLLDAAESAETPPPTEAFEQREVEAQTRQPESQPKPAEAKPGDLPDGTQAAADPNATATPKVEDSPTAEAPKPGDRPAAAPAKDSFARDKARRDDSWKKLNEEKSAFQQERDQFKAERDYHARERQQFEQERAKAANRYTPEQYEQGSAVNAEKAATLELQADGLEKRAAAAEEADRYDEAKRLRSDAGGLRKKAAYHEELAGQLKAEAQHKRENPDPDAAKLEQSRQQSLRDYTMEANKRWPDVFKQGSELNKTVVAHIQAARQSGLEVKDHPVLIYHAARLTAAEAAAACVPGLNKELGELRAKVKELEALTSPGGGTSAPANLQHDTPKTDEEEGASLRNTAVAMG